MFHRYSLFLCLIGAPMFFTACGTPSTTQKEVTTAPANEAESLQAVLTQYETLRAAFAEDRLADVPALAGTLEAGIKAAQAHPAKDIAESLATLLQKMQPLKAEGTPDTLRQHFGDVSLWVVTILTVRTSLQSGRHIFECPMAQGYTKWVQVTDAIENPYMGGAMLRCGGPSSWTP